MCLAPQAFKNEKLIVGISTRTFHSTTPSASSVPSNLSWAYFSCNNPSLERGVNILLKITWLQHFFIAPQALKWLFMMIFFYDFWWFFDDSAFWFQNSFWFPFLFFLQQSLQMKGVDIFKKSIGTLPQPMYKIKKKHKIYTTPNCHLLILYLFTLWDLILGPFKKILYCCLYRHANKRTKGI